MGYLGNKCSSSRTPQTFKCKRPLTSPYHRLHLRCVSEAPSDDPETIWLLREFYRGAVRRVIGVIIHPISSAINKQLHNKLANMNPRKKILPCCLDSDIPMLKPQNIGIEETTRTLIQTKDRAHLW